MNSPTLLYIDDLPQALELRKATLEAYGYSVKTALNGHSALEMLEKVSVAAVLLEYKMEGMDAEAIACHIRQRFPNLPIILLSAYSEMPERILWLVDDYVMKSELPERLVPIIERAHRLAQSSKQRLSRSKAAAYGQSLALSKAKDRHDILAATRRRILPPSVCLATTQWQWTALSNLCRLWNCV